MKEVQLTKGFVAIVDDDDYEWISRHKWKAKIKQGHNVYASRSLIVNGRSSGIEMHRAIMRFPEGLVVDHANRNTLDNRKENLRIATYTLNNANRAKTKGRTYKGLNRKGNLWRARVRINGKVFHIGYFADPVDAALAYDAKARELFGEFAKTNFPT